MATSIDQKDHIRTALRVPPELHVQIHQAAQASGRSFNAEIIARLSASFEPVTAPDVVREIVREEVARAMQTTARKR